MQTKAATQDTERALLNDASIEHGWRLIERFSALVRESGMPDEHTAAEYIARALDALGVEHHVYEPNLYISLPRESSVTMHGGTETMVRAKPPSFAAATSPQGITAPAVFFPAPPMQDLGEIFEDKGQGDASNVHGKIVVTEGYAMPQAVQRFEQAGAVGQVYINPGRNIHWGICTTIWGTPTHENMRDKPHTPVVAISRPDGHALVRYLESGGESVTIRTRLEEGWVPCKLPVATIRGSSDDFILVHGHYDSWDVGIGDNAVGDATLLELARVFHQYRGELKRSLKIAWWPGHSTGRYAGSTWFADTFAMDLRKRCVAAVNIDSPGCWRAEAFEDVMWMAEADELCREAVLDATGVQAERRRPIRAGDYSFNQIGLTSFFMLLSNIPKTVRDELEFYPVGGCGGNIAWHTEDDTIEVADKTYLKQDLRVYVTALARVLNTDILPFNYRATVAELRGAVVGYQRAAGDLFDLSAVSSELDALENGLNKWYARVETGTAGSDEQVNDTLKELARILVPIGYAKGARFSHDPACPLGVIPKLDDIGSLSACAQTSPDLLPFLQAGIARYANEVANALYEAARLVTLPD